MSCLRGLRLHLILSAVTCVFSAAAGCSGITRYVQGPQPVAALPSPRWTIRGAPELENAFSSQPLLTFSAAVLGTEPGIPPALGFSIYLKDISPAEFGARPAAITVKAWTQIRPRTKSGGRVTVAVTNGRSRELMILDDDGIIFHAFAGEIFPSAEESGPLQFATTHDPAYYQVTQGRDLCGQTWVHSRVSVASDLATATLSPGGGARIRGSHNGNVWHWHVASADSAFLDESDCPGEYPPAVFFLMAREGRAAEGADDFKGLKKIGR